MSLHIDLHVDVVGTGFTVLDRIYADGDLADEALGGSCGNVLVSLAMLRRNVAPVLALGNDAEGDRLVREFLLAGADTRYIHRRTDLRSPILAQELDTSSGMHEFSFLCPETNTELPRYQPIGEAELMSAMSVFRHCSIFYTDRLSRSIIDAMRTAWSAGAIVFFEPSAVEEEALFEQALAMTSVLKYSADRLGDRLANLRADCVRIVTHGAAGLEVADRASRIWCDAVLATTLMDTCGSGDMVSVGLIDWMLTHGVRTHLLRATDLLCGVVAGQRLAAENCGYAGARGLFKERGPEYARRILT